jgi:hypothetical protein
MDSIIQDLERRKKVLAKDKQEMAEAIGSEKQLMTQLIAEFNIDDLESAKVKFEELGRENEEMRLEIESDHQVIKEKFPW